VDIEEREENRKYQQWRRYNGIIINVCGGADSTPQKSAYREKSLLNGHGGSLSKSGKIASLGIGCLSKTVSHRGDSRS